MKNILIIDDDEAFMKAVCTVLKNKARLTTVNSRSEFYKFIDQEVYDLIITDYKMNFWDGLEVVQFIRKKYPKLPVIILSAFADKEMAIKCANFKIHKILEKPFELSDLYSAIDEAFALSSRSANALAYGPVTLHDEHYYVRIDSAQIQLTETEFKIFKLLVLNIEKIVERHEFKKTIWDELVVAPNVLDTHLLNLKKKLPLLKERIKNTRGKGYFLAAYV